MKLTATTTKHARAATRFHATMLCVVALYLTTDPRSTGEMHEMFTP